MTSNKRYHLDQVGIRMVKEPPLYSSEPMSSPASAVRLMSELLRQYDRELLCVVNLQNDLKPINVNIVSIGTINGSIAHPREILKSTILSNAASIMLFHNHPSGNLTPSIEDINLTDRMAKAGQMLGIPVMDHIIIGNDDRYFSFRENQVLKVPEIQYATDITDINLQGTAVAEPSSSFTGFKEESSLIPRQQAMKDLTDKLEKGVQDIFSSGKYQAYLTSMSKFHHYSLNNTILIALQRPDASLVAGYQAWKSKHGRQVRKGEKGIKILAPAPYKIKEEKNVIDPVTRQPVIDSNGKPKKETITVERPAFKIATVFDVSQTDGKELPTLGVDELSGDVQYFGNFFEALKRTSNVPIAFEDIPSGAKGYYHLEDKRIAIQEGMSEVQTVKTAIHEMSHARLHSKEKMKESGVEKSSRTKEVEAESVAFCVSAHYGIDTSDYSFGYIAGWSSGKETAELKASLETIRSTASEMITQIDEHLQEIQKEKGLEQSTAEPALNESAEIKSVLGTDHNAGKDSVLAKIKALEKETAVKLSPESRITSSKRASPEL